MAGLCIPKSIADKVKAAVKSGDINLEKLYGMSSDERNTIFSHYVGEGSADMVNSEFEKAMVTADKAAKADYVTTSEKESFAAKAAAGEFGKKLITPEQARKLSADKIDAKIAKVQDRQTTVREQMKGSEGENRANFQTKLDKLADEEAQLNVRKENTLNPTSDATLKKIGKISKLLSPKDDDAMLESLVASKMGQDLTPAEGKYVVEKSIELQKLGKNMSDTPTGVTADYLNAKRNLDSYIENLNPDSTISIIKNVIETARNNLILGLATPLKTLVNYANHPAAMLIRRLGSLSLNGDYAAESKAFLKENNSILKKTGTSPAQMTSINDAGTVLGSRFKDNQLKTKSENFDEPNKGRVIKGTVGVIEKITELASRASHYVAITLEHTKMYNYVYDRTFSDIANLHATELAKTESLYNAQTTAKQEGLKGNAYKARVKELTNKDKSSIKQRGLEILKDAWKIEPTTDAGKALRTAAQAGAAHVTNTDDTYASQAVVGIKNALNHIGGSDIPIGDLVEPMAKIPMNVISHGIANTPVGSFQAIFDIARGRLNMAKNQPLETRYEGAAQYARGVQHAIAIFGSLAISSLITNQLTKKDFRSDAYGDHYMKFGNYWVSTEYIGRLSPDVAGLMALKMAPKENPMQAFLIGNATGQGALGGALNAPIINVGSALAGVLGKHPIDYIESTAESRLPIAATDLFKTRPINRLFFGSTGVESVQDVAADNAATKKKAAATRRADAIAKVESGE